MVILRGALDGMAAVVPYGDPGLAALRGELVPPAPGQPDGVLDLGGFYGLHPALADLHAMYHGERGADRPRRRRPLPRAQPFRGAGLPGMRRRPPHDQRLAEPRGGGAAGVRQRRGRRARRWPSACRCRCCCAARRRWRTGRRTGSRQPAPDLYAAIAALNARRSGDRPGDRRGPARARLQRRGAGRDDGRRPKDRNAFPALALAAGEMLRAPDGPRIAALEIGGWDTHPPSCDRLDGAAEAARRRAGWR